MTYDTAELKRLMEAGQFTKPLCIDYAELGLDDNTRLVAFLMHGDPDDGEYVCVDEDPRGLDVPSPRLEAIAAAVNALPALLARVEELEGALTEIARCERYVAEADTNYELEMRRIELDRLIQSSAARLKGGA